MSQSSSEPRPAPAAGLLSIGDVAGATGISTETLRMWERRYGRPEAVRLPSGHRRYTQEQVRWLRRVAEALARGNRPHKVVALSEEALEELLTPSATPASDAALERRIGYVHDFAAELLFSELERAWRPEDPVGYLDEEVAPLVQGVGRRWADGTLEIRHEHHLSELLMDLLRKLRARYERRDTQPRVLLATLSGEWHGLGLQMAALVSAVRGVPLRILGVNTPNGEIFTAAAEAGVQVVGVSVSLANAGVETDSVLAELRAALPGDVRLVVGGEGARGVRRGPRKVDYAPTLAAWDRVLDDLD